MNLDLSNLTLAQAAVVLVIVTALEVASAYLLAVVHGNFDLGVVAVWLQSHTIRRVFPIFALAVVGSGIPQLGVPAIAPAYALALAALAAYVLETVASLRDSFGDASRPTDVQPSD